MANQNQSEVRTVKGLLLEARLAEHYESQMIACETIENMFADLKEENQRISDENLKAKQDIFLYRETVKQREIDLKILKEENAILREALEFYAGTKGLLGELARQTLKELGRGSKIQKEVGRE